MKKQLNKWQTIKEGWNDRRSNLLEKEALLPLSKETSNLEQKQLEIIRFIHGIEKELKQKNRGY